MSKDWENQLKCNVRNKNTGVNIITLDLTKNHNNQLLMLLIKLCISNIMEENFKEVSNFSALICEILGKYLLI